MLEAMRMRALDERYKAEKVKGQKEDVNLIKEKESWFDVGSIMQKMKRQFKGKKIIIANFELMTGHHTITLAVVDDNGKFSFRGKDYIIDDNLKYYSMAYKDWVLDYHESFCLPIKRKIPINQINDAMQQTNLSGVSFATNPSTLKTFLTNNVVQSAIQGASITAFFKQIRLWAMLAAIAAIIHLLLFMNQSGMFSKITGAVGGG